MSIRTDGKAAYICISDFECARRGRQIVDLQRELAAAQAEIEGLQRKIGALEQVANQAEAQCKVLNQSAQAENAALREGK